MEPYDHKQIEAKWQAEWERRGIYQAENEGQKKKYYVLVEFPYPSADGLHVGHPRPYIGLDIIARKRRMEGYNVLYPMGWDAFGLPTENYAIKTGIQPAIVTKQNTDNFRRQIKMLGASFDWSREINTTDPKYYKWTQWIFLQFFKKGLAYKAKMPINWCPKDKIGLANEEVVGGCCERCGTPVEVREKEQWLLAITKYADRLEKDLDGVDYPESVKIQQRNWIGRSEGALIKFEIVANPTPDPLPEGEGAPGYHTTDAATWRVLQDQAVKMRQNPTEAEEELWQKLRDNALGCHFRRQHIISKFIVDFVCLEQFLVVEIDGDIHDYQMVADRERTQSLEALGYKIIRFKNNEILDDVEKVLTRIKQALPLGEGAGGVIEIFTTRPETIYGATFIAIPGAVDRFTSRLVTNPANGKKIPVWEAEYVMPDVGTGAIMGVPAYDERDFAFAQKHNLPLAEKPLKDSEMVLKKVGGKKIVRYKLRDWIFSRQRYWGDPIPIIHCQKCGIIPVPEQDLPVILPEVKNYQPRDDGQSPLASVTDWVNVKCPKCGGAARRETDTMPNWAGSSWYYLRYLDPDNDQALAAPEKIKHWTPVDWYNGGMEHTNLHLLYSRFWHKFLFDIGVVPTSEPYRKRTSHGLILAAGGEKMSKSKGNVVNPDKIVELYGADTLRLYEMFMGPFEQAVAWSEASIIGSRRFLEKVWRLASEKVISNRNLALSMEAQALLDKTVNKVSADIEKMAFNTAVSQLMILVNGLKKEPQIGRATWRTFLLILAPFAPHLSEELWTRLGELGSIHSAGWPVSLDNKTTIK